METCHEQFKKQNVKLRGYGIKLKRLKDHNATQCRIWQPQPFTPRILTEFLYSDRILIGQETKWHWNSCGIQFRPEKLKNSKDKMR